MPLNNTLHRLDYSWSFKLQINWWGCSGRYLKVVGFTTTYSMQSVPITADIMSSNLDQGEVYNIM